MSAKAVLKGLVLLATLVLLGFTAKTSGLMDGIDKAWVDSDVRGQGGVGELLFVAVGVAFTALGLPRQVICFLGGYAFGFMAGTGLALLATVIGCVGAFFYARLLGRSLVTERFPERVARIDAFLSGNPFTMTLLIRFLPIGSNLVTNLAAGVSGVPALAFFTGSVIGYIPQTAIFALAGSGVTLDQGAQVGVSIVLFVVAGALGVHLYRRYRHGRTLGDQIERELGGE